MSFPNMIECRDSSPTSAIEYSEWSDSDPIPNTRNRLVLKNPSA